MLIQRGAVETQRQAAEHLALHRTRIARWLKLYRDGGLAPLLEVGTAGAPRGPRLLPPSAFQALQDRLAAEGFASYIEAQQWIERAFDLRVDYLRVDYKSLHKLIRYRLGAKLKRSRPRHPKRMRPKQRSSCRSSAVRAEAAQFVKTLGRRLEHLLAFAEAAGQRLRLFCQDESRFGLHLPSRRRLTSRGTESRHQAAPPGGSHLRLLLALRSG